MNGEQIIFIYRYDGKQLSKLQQNNNTGCFSEYLGISGLKVLSNLQMANKV
jgi:hypothetical protein